jgi:thiamine kinase-like enzyme
VGKKAVINYIIDSYPDAQTFYIMLGHNSNYVREYLEHCEYTNIQYINIENWKESQFASLQQLPDHIFDTPFYLNSCDNWSTLVPIVTKNTAFFCKPKNMEYYDTVNGEAFAGIGFVHDTYAWRRALMSSKKTRNDYLLHNALNLEHQQLKDWHDVGNVESLQVTLDLFDSEIDLLDKKHQEIYYVNKRVIKLFNKPIIGLIDSLTKNFSFPHPNNIKFTDRGLSYTFQPGRTNPSGPDFDRVFNNLCDLWKFCVLNNSKHNARNIWQEKTVERFDCMIKNYPEFSKPLVVNGRNIDPIRILENIDWNIVNTGLYGPCHGDLNLDNIIVQDSGVLYIDHREGFVTDIFYDVCKFYHSLHLNNKVLKNFKFNVDQKNYQVDIVHSADDIQKQQQFRTSWLYKQYQKKIELGVGCIWLSMAPLNVSDNLNRFLFLYAIEHLDKWTKKQF